MTSKSMGKTTKNVWTVLIVILVAVFSFAGGYLAGITISGQNEGFTIVDDYGRTVTLDGIPQRIGSRAPSSTEILFAVGAGPQVVGVDNYSDYPAEAAGLPKVGAFPPSTEAIVALQPDLIVGGDLVPLAQLEQLANQGIPYVLFADPTLEAVMKALRLPGVITGHVSEADEVAGELEDRIDAVKAKIQDSGLPKPKVYVEDDDFMGFWTYGPGSFGGG